jgi:hypothetical protein
MTEVAGTVEAVDQTLRPDDVAALRSCILDYVEFALLARTSDGWRITGTLWRWATGHGPRA